MMAKTRKEQLLHGDEPETCDCCEEECECADCEECVPEPVAEVKRTRKT